MKQGTGKKSIFLIALACVLLVLAGGSVLLLHWAQTALPRPAGETPATPAPETPAAPQKPEERWFTVRYGDTELYTDGWELLRRMAAGERLRQESENGDYLRVTTEDGVTGWVHRAYVRAEDEELERQREAERFLSLVTQEGFAAQEEADYTVIRPELPLRDAPSGSTLVVTAATGGDVLQVIGTQGEYALCRLKEGGYAYARSEALMPGIAYATVPGGVDLRSYLPEAEFELLFASPNNVTNHALYPPIPFLEKTTAKMLKEAWDIFKADGYTIKIYDAYRPKSAQYALYDIVQDSRFIGNPYENNSWHQLGRAVDMSLICDATGEELEMPTPMHTFSLDAARYKAPEWSLAARKNVEYMTRVMESVGFHTINSEWWHFENSESGGALALELDYNSIVYVPADEVEYEY